MTVLGWPLSTLNHLNFYILHCLMHLRDWQLKDYKFDVKVECATHSLRTTNCPWLGVVRSCDPLQNFVDSNHITGTAEPKVVKFCTRVGNISSMQQDDISPTIGRGYGHVTFKILPLVVLQRDARVCQRQLSYLLFTVKTDFNGCTVNKDKWESANRSPHHQWFCNAS